MDGAIDNRVGVKSGLSGTIVTYRQQAEQVGGKGEDRSQGPD